MKPIRDWKDLQRIADNEDVYLIDGEFVREILADLIKISRGQGPLPRTLPERAGRLIVVPHHREGPSCIGFGTLAMAKPHTMSMVEMRGYLAPILRGFSEAPDKQPS